MRTYFEGKKELFTGLKIEELERENKRDKDVDEALKQIEDKGYAKPYAADKRTLLKIGVSFNSKDRTIDGWKVV